MPRRLSRASVVRVFLPRSSVSSTRHSSHILIRCSTRRHILGKADAPEDLRQLLQTADPVGSSAFTRLAAQFRDWYCWTLDLPGTYYLEVVEKLYKDNELATGRFVALGQTIDLAAVRAPLYLLAGRDDELVAPAQLLATERLVGTPVDEFRKEMAPCRHLGLFMGKAILGEFWPRIVRWLVASAATAPEKVEPQRTGASGRQRAGMSAGSIC